MFRYHDQYNGVVNNRPPLIAADRKGLLRRTAKGYCGGPQRVKRFNTVCIINVSLNIKELLFPQTVFLMSKISVFGLKYDVFYFRFLKTLCLRFFGCKKANHCRNYIPPPRVGGFIWKTSDLSIGFTKF